MKKNKIKLSIIIVYYHGIKSLKRLISSIFKNKINFNFEVIIVNNSKNKDVKESLTRSNKDIIYVKSSNNIGYGGGNNLGVKYSQGEYILILNPDTKLINNSVNELVNFLDRKNDCAIVSPNLIHSNGKLFKKMGSRRLTPLEGIFAISFINKLFPENKISNRYYLKDLNFKKLRKVSAVPGSAFLIRKNVFNKIGGFDENIFMYFEENDIGERVINLGYKIFINPKSEIIHYWYSKKKKSKKLQVIFKKSRFYYFKKHFGIISALTVEVINRINKINIAFFLILILASYLRLYGIDKYLNFGGDNAWYYLSAKDMILNNNFPLLGIPSSVPVLKQGAVWTWILAIFLNIFKFNPIAGGYLSAIFGILSIVLIYIITERIFNSKIALIASVITSFSSYLMINDRMPYVTTPIFTSTLILYLFLILAIRGKKWAYFASGIILSILYQFELAGAFLFLPIITTFIIFRKKLNIRNIVIFISGIFIGLSPFIISDLRKGVFMQTYGFAGWMLTKIIESIFSIVNFNRNTYLDEIPYYLKQFIIPNSYVLSISIIVFLTVIFIKELFVKKIIFKGEYLLLLIWGFLGISAFFIRGSFSVAYFPLLFLPIILILSISLYWMFKNNMRVLYLALLIFALSNILYFKNFNNNLLKSNVFNYPKQLEVSEFIINFVEGKRYSLQYLSSNIQFESSIDNFRYLLWYMGNEPVTLSDNRLILVDNEKYFDIGEPIKSFGNINIYKL